MSTSTPLAPLIHGSMGCYQSSNPERVIGEADVVTVLADGSLVVGECKTRAAGLNDGELEKLWTLGERLNATMTFVATLDLSSHCDEIWKRPSNKRHHVSLTGEHLFDPMPIGIVGGPNPLDWRDAYVRGIEAGFTEARFCQLFADDLLHIRDWTRAGHQPSGERSPSQRPGCRSRPPGPRF